MFEALQQLSLASLRSLAGSLREGGLSMGMTRHAVEQIAGPHAVAVHACLDGLLCQGITPQQAALLVEAVAETRALATDRLFSFDLVLSRSYVPGVPTSDTQAVLHTLIEEAAREILLVGYAVHNVQTLFDRLAARMRALPSLRVRFCLDITRKPTDTSLPSEIVRRFAHEFRTKHWPWAELPDLF